MGSRGAAAGVLALCGCSVLNPLWDEGGESTTSGAETTTSLPSTSAATSSSTTDATQTASGGETGTSSAGSTSITTTSTSTGTTTTSTSTSTSTGEPTTDTGEPMGVDCFQGADLIACYDFPADGADGVLVDGSMYGHHGAMSSVDLVASAPGFDKAAQQTGDSYMRRDDLAPNDDLFDVAGSIALLAIVRLDALPAAGQRFGVVDKNGQYSVFIADDGDVRCQFGSFIDPSGVKVPVGAWTHIGCAFDGAEVRVYLNGALKSSFAVDTALNVGNPEPLVIGGDSPGPKDQLLGALDNLEIWRTSLDDLAICARAGPLCDF
ncbi:MAG: LamG domain-containing protein [Myxococcales bacterium]|nr:LamG domain-containing protein [Myxococcales bacterium]